MPGKFPQTFVDDLVARVDIVDVIDSRVPLKAAGRNHVARCPFHNEKTPSFTVNREKQLFYCFGCGAGGSVIGFMMDYDHSSFSEAVEDLARIAGMEVPRTENVNQQSEHSSELRRLYELQEQVAIFYYKQLQQRNGGEAAIRYLKSRGVNGQTAREFRLGFAQPGWDTLSKHFPGQELLRSGLVVAKDNGQTYDRFRNRVIFPIRDKRGRVVGFGGRVLDASLPKYLNSPETKTFQKSKQLYGLYELLTSKSRPQQILIVEGYLDVIALAQHGVRNAVATLGTAVSASHFDLLFRVTSELVFCFDGDEAGKQAAWKAVETALPKLTEGRSVRIMLLPVEHDPDSYIREQGRERFEQAVKESTLLSDYFFDYICADLNLESMEDCANLVAKAKPGIAKLPSGTFRDLMEARLRELARVKNVEFNNFGNTARAKKPNALSAPRRKQLSPLQRVIVLIMHHTALVRLLDLSDPRLSGSSSPGILLLLKIAGLIDQQPNITLGGLLEHFRETPEEASVQALAKRELLVPSEGIEIEFKDAFARVLERLNENRLEQLLEIAGSRRLSVEERREVETLLPSSAVSQE